MPEGRTTTERSQPQNHWQTILNAFEMQDTDRALTLGTAALEPSIEFLKTTLAPRSFQITNAAPRDSIDHGRAEHSHIAKIIGHYNNMHQQDGRHRAGVEGD
ncbi:hypothetical protein FALBO_16846, partial [Fusarium albosuccineum]